MEDVSSGRTLCIKISTCSTAGKSQATFSFPSSLKCWGAIWRLHHCYSETHVPKFPFTDGRKANNMAESTKLALAWGMQPSETSSSVSITWSSGCCHRWHPAFIPSSPHRVNQWLVFRPSRSTCHLGVLICPIASVVGVGSQCCGSMELFHQGPHVWGCNMASEWCVRLDESQGETGPLHGRKAHFAHPPPPTPKSESYK